MARRGIPTARAGAFTEVGPAVAFVDELGGRAVVKADGLAGRQGRHGRDEPRRRPSRRSGLPPGAARSATAGAAVVVEEILEGPEVSAFAL